jgi:hypothetical protein
LFLQINQFGYSLFDQQSALIRLVYGWLSPKLFSRYPPVIFQPHLNVLNGYTRQYPLDRQIDLFPNAAEHVPDVSPYGTPWVWRVPVERENTRRLNRSIYVQQRYLFWFARQAGTTPGASLGNDQIAVRQFTQHSPDHNRICVDTSCDLFGFQGMIIGPRHHGQKMGGDCEPAATRHTGICNNNSYRL